MKFYRYDLYDNKWILKYDYLNKNYSNGVILSCRLNPPHLIMGVWFCCISFGFPNFLVSRTVVYFYHDS